MFIGDYAKDAAWNESGLKGCFKFLNRVWNLQEKVNEENKTTPSLESCIHKTIKKVTEDIENLDYNTAVSALMILLNEYEKQESISREDYKILLQLLNPFAPHMTEELAEILKYDSEISAMAWPSYDEEKLVEDTFTMVVQVNGRVRGKIEIDTNTTEEEMKEKAKQIENVKVFIEGKTIIKEIVISKKLVNIVVQ